MPNLRLGLYKKSRHTPSGEKLSLSGHTRRGESASRLFFGTFSSNVSHFAGARGGLWQGVHRGARASGSAFPRARPAPALNCFGLRFRFETLRRDPDPRLDSLDQVRVLRRSKTHINRTRLGLVAEILRLLKTCTYRGLGRLKQVLGGKKFKKGTEASVYEKLQQRGDAANLYEREATRETFEEGART